MEREPGPAQLTGGGPLDVLGQQSESVRDRVNRMAERLDETRHIAQLAPWADARPQYRLKLGPLLISFDNLTDDALDALRSRIAGDVRGKRARRR